ncbi:hypothetical protein J6590_024204 [Homalodisca vitripennis]|nr:hypothetical protein J6590_024204 [Homalodisca vitripennis]
MAKGVADHLALYSVMTALVRPIRVRKVVIRVPQNKQLGDTTIFPVLLLRQDKNSPSQSKLGTDFQPFNYHSHKAVMHVDRVL